MKILAVVFVFVFSFSAFIRAADYLDDYNRGSLAIQLGNCDEGEPLIQQALKVNSKGDFRKNYFPQYFLAVCAMSRNDLDAAQKLSKQAEGSGISFSSMAKEYAKFKTQLQARLKEPKSQKLVLAVVVNSENSISDITRQDLCKIYRGERKTWDNGTPIVPVLGPAGSAENRAFLSSICGLDEKALNALWQAQNATPPSMIEKKEWILRFVFSNPGAIAFYPVDGSTQQVKVINVDGKQASDASYPIVEL